MYSAKGFEVYCTVNINMYTNLLIVVCGVHCLVCSEILQCAVCNEYCVACSVKCSALIVQCTLYAGILCGERRKL